MPLSSGESAVALDIESVNPDVMLEKLELRLAICEVAAFVSAVDTAPPLNIPVRKLGAAGAVIELLQYLPVFFIRFSRDSLSQPLSELRNDTTYLYGQTHLRRLGLFYCASLPKILAPSL
jgi:hypothetical protein